MKTHLQHLLLLAACVAVLPASVLAQPGQVGSASELNSKRQNLTPTLSQMVAQATVAQSAAPTYDRVIGICHLSANPYDPTSAQNVMGPPGEVKVYYFNYEKDKIQGSATVSVLKAPAHGRLVDEGGGDYSYFPDKGFLGNDRATLLVEMGGKKIRMEYFFRVMTSVHEGEGVDPYADNCPKKVRVWKISSAKDAYGNHFIAAVDINASQTAVANDPAALSSWLALGQLPSFGPYA